MSEAVSKSDVADHLREDGFDQLAEYVHGGTRLTDLETSDLLAAIDDAWVVRLRNDDEEIHYCRARNGDLIQAHDGDRDGEFGTPHRCYRDEFEDYVFSGDYAVDFIYPEESAFEVADDE